MRPWVGSFGAAALFALIFPSAAFTGPVGALTVDPSCDSRRQMVLDALKEADYQATNAANLITGGSSSGTQRGTPTSPNPRVRDLLYSLLGGRDDQEVMSRGATAAGTLEPPFTRRREPFRSKKTDGEMAEYFRAASQYVQSAPAGAKIYCGDTFLVGAQNNEWKDTRNNAIIKKYTPCTQKNSLAFGLNDSIIICPRQWTRMEERNIRPTLAAYKETVADRTYLDDLETLSTLLFHQIAFLAGRVARDPVVDQTVGFAQSYELAQGQAQRRRGLLTRRDARPPSTRNAETLTLISTALLFVQKYAFNFGYASEDGLVPTKVVR